MYFVLYPFGLALTLLVPTPLKQNRDWWHIDIMGIVASILSFFFDFPSNDGGNAEVLST